jgi:hypothetical protein
MGKILPCSSFFPHQLGKKKNWCCIRKEREARGSEKSTMIMVFDKSVGKNIIKRMKNNI